MKVILQQDIKGQGKKGQMVDVSDGYARNYLLPRKLAVAATTDNLNAMKVAEKARLAQIERDKANAKVIAEKLDSRMDFRLYMYVGYGHAAFDTAPDYQERLLQFFLS